MKILCISDTHGKHEYLTDLIEEKEGWDLLIHAGDFSNLGYVDEIRKFDKWLKSISHKFKHMIVIAGNHDIGCSEGADFLRAQRHHHSEHSINTDRSREGLRLENATMLFSESAEVEGIKIYGEMRQPWFHNWAFNVEYSQGPEVWKDLPDDIQILVSHGPPYKMLDKTDDGRLVGCKALAEKVINHPTLELVVCGHIHEDYGILSVPKANGQRCIIINASFVNLRMSPINKPIEYDTDTKLTNFLRYNKDITFLEVP